MFEQIESAGGERANRSFKVSLKEGRNREVRRMWTAIGYEVSRLMRINFGPIELPRNLRRGKCEALLPAQVRLLYLAAGLKPPAAMRARDSKTRRRQRHRNQ